VPDPAIEQPTDATVMIIATNKGRQVVPNPEKN
jgi:hypothetical protein